MEWVVTTGKTIADAKEAALDQLGVDEAEAEFEVLEEPKAGLFGRVRREARVRARVRPRTPRPKAERRRPSRGDRKGRSRSGNGRGKSGTKGGKASSEARVPKAGGTDADRDDRKAGSRPSGAEAEESSGTEADAGQTPKPATDGRPTGGRNRNRTTKGSSTRTRATAPTPEETTMSEPVSVQEQGQIVRGFLEGLLDAFDLDGEVAVNAVDDETVEVTVEGEDLGVLIGPKGQTLQAIQELSRASLQRSADGPLDGRVRIDIGAYRQKRREALARFAHQQAQEVLDEGVERALEPMNAADRKVVHDTVNEIPGVRTVSEGEDARRRVVIIPD